ncbi:DUF397 domain-containing protein [Streptomyces sp. NPDC001941]|uniref:DUF397 domain-containing protein n=1 Tax=Streptomyces sp. NPDC001941 TaxID=3154659 RepID=UPI00331D9F54
MSAHAHRITHAVTHPDAPVDVLVDSPWRRSSYSVGMNNCVETAPLEGGRLAVRDSKRPAGARLGFSGPAWHAFAAALRAEAVS